VQRGVIIGVRQVMISASGTIGAVTGGAAGGVAGAQISGGPVTTALGAIGGTLVGGIGGTAAAQAVANTKGWEYIVQEPGDKLVSVTQTSKTALPVGLNVLVISDAQQARIVPDYTVQTAAAAPAAKAAVTTGPTETAAVPDGSTPPEINLSPLPPSTDAAEPLQVTPITTASDPTTQPGPSPASTDPAATPPAPSATPDASATPGAVNNKSPANGTPSAGSTGTSSEVAPVAPASTSPAASPSTAKP
jgi:outer membrane lipoprotein SlyB